LTESHAGTLSASPIFMWLRQYLFDFGLGNLMLVDVRLVCLRINIEPKLHCFIR